jgi:hypothetical protein
MNLDAHSALILRSRALRGVSKDGVGCCVAWFETRCFAALLTMRPIDFAAYGFRVRPCGPPRNDNTNHHTSSAPR